MNIQNVNLKSYVFCCYKGRFDDWHVPLLYVLMTDKLEKSYDEIFSVLQRLQPKLNPTDVTVDFEKAAINSINKAFPMAEVHCCRFHFGQNIYRHVQQVGLQSVYRSDDDFAFEIKLLTALSFVPPENVIDAYNELMKTPFYSENSDSPYKKTNTTIGSILSNNIRLSSGSKRSTTSTAIPTGAVECV